MAVSWSNRIRAPFDQRSLRSSVAERQVITRLAAEPRLLRNLQRKRFEDVIAEAYRRRD